MKYCVSSRQQKKILNKADEIRVAYKDIGHMMDLIEEEELKDKVYIIDIPKEIELSEEEWILLKGFDEKVKVVICLYELKQHLIECITYGLKFYWAYPITSWYDYEDILKLKPSYLFLGAPLSFSLDKITKDIPIRLCPNLAYDAYIPREDGLYGGWVRPEDIDKYDTYVSVMDFMGVNLSEEAKLLEIYLNKKWPGNLNLLIKNFKINIDNRALPDEIGEMRMTCDQRCKIPNRSCHFCDVSIRFAEQLRISHYNNIKENLRVYDEETDLY